MATTSVSLRANIELLHEDGLSVRAIAARLGTARSTVQDIITIFKRTGTTAARKSPGRPRITSTQADDFIRREAIMDPRTSSSAIQAALPPHVAISTRTITQKAPA